MALKTKVVELRFLAYISKYVILFFKHSTKKRQYGKF